VGGLRLGVVSCANWQAGYFSAYRHLVARGDLDAVLHLGDYVSLTLVLDGDPAVNGRFAIAQNGGADLLYWTGPADDRDTAVARMRALVTTVPGVLAVHDPAQLRLGPEAGDRAGWRFTGPTPLSNPIPGNQGHPATEPIPFVVAGGSPLVRRGVVASAPARTLDVAPTVGAPFRLRPARRVRQYGQAGGVRVVLLRRSA